MPRVPEQRKMEIKGLTIHAFKTAFDISPTRSDGGFCVRPPKPQPPIPLSPSATDPTEPFPVTTSLYSAMSESINEKSEASPSTSAQEASLDHVEEAMNRLRIRPVSVWSV